MPSAEQVRVTYTICKQNGDCQSAACEWTPSAERARVADLPPKWRRVRRNTTSSPIPDNAYGNPPTFYSSCLVAQPCVLKCLSHSSHYTTSPKRLRHSTVADAIVRGSNPVRITRTNCEFVRVKYAVLTRSRCAQPPCVHARPHKNNHVRTLKIL